MRKMSYISDLSARRSKIIGEISELQTMLKGVLNATYPKVAHKDGNIAVKGPYYVLTRKGDDGKTVTKSIPAEDVPRIQQEVGNYKKFRALSDEFVNVCEELSLTHGDGDEVKKTELLGEYELEIYRFAETVREMAANGDILDMREIEEGFRKAALSGASVIFSRLLSDIPESTPVCPKCGSTMRGLGKRKKNITSLLGEGEITRGYYECENCHEHSIPKDDLLGIKGTSFTPGVRRAVAKLASCDSFESSSAGLLELCGIFVSSKDTERIAESIGERIENSNAQRIKTTMAGNIPAVTLKPGERIYIEFDGTGVPMTKRELTGRRGKQDDGSSKTREAKVGCIFTQSSTDAEGNPIRDKESTTYFGAIESAETFGARLYGEAVYRGVNTSKEVVVIGDGAKWIWNLAAIHFPNTIEIVDLFHAKEHVWNIIKQTVSNEQTRQFYKKDCYELLEKGDIYSLTARLASLPSANNEQSKAINREIGYFSENAARMQYAKFKKAGLFVGSGVIEAACKNVIGKRLKQSGMRWSLQGANSIIALRCSVLSGFFDFDIKTILAA
jgi:hypothetical protein